jgi:L-ribulose-5-phosphate 4-epimerase
MSEIDYDRTNVAVRAMVKAFQLMAKRNDVLQDTHGNLSMRMGDQIFIKPSGVPYEDIGLHEVCHYVFDQQGKYVELRKNGLRPSVDLFHHVNIYNANPHVKAICHTHSPHAVAFAICGKSIPCCTTEQADYFGGRVTCLPYKDLNEWSMGISLRQNERALLLANHGALTFADDPLRAVNLAIQLENVARKNVLARCLGQGPLDLWELDPADSDRWHERYNNVYGQR